MSARPLTLDELATIRRGLLDSMRAECASARSRWQRGLVACPCCGGRGTHEPACELVEIIEAGST